MDGWHSIKWFTSAVLLIGVAWRLSRRSFITRNVPPVISVKIVFVPSAVNITVAISESYLERVTERWSLHAQLILLPSEQKRYPLLKGYRPKTLHLQWQHYTSFSNLNPSSKFKIVLVKAGDVWAGIFGERSTLALQWSCRRCVDPSWARLLQHTCSVLFTFW